MKTNKGTVDKIWRKTLLLLTGLLVVWFSVSFGIVILLGDALSNVRFLGCSLPFWFGQQGAILVFVALLIVYAVGIEKINAEFIVEMENNKGELENDEPERYERKEVV